MFTYKKDMFAAIALGIIWSLILLGVAVKNISLEKILSPIAMTFQPLRPLEEAKSTNEVFGFAPYWNMKKFHAIDFDVLTTMAYFDLKATADGEIIKDDEGYRSFTSREATTLFKRAHEHGTRVVATVTMMDGPSILAFLDNPEAQDNLIKESVSLVKKRGIDGINIDIEYFGSPNTDYQPKFSRFVKNMTTHMHETVPGSKVSVSLYASVVKSPRIFDLASIASSSDIIFMMAYDYATKTSDYAMPTAPLYGHKEGKFWYDVSTAVDDFLTKMPANKLVLGVPYYNLNFPVETPKMKATTLPYWYGASQTITYDTDKRFITPTMEGVTKFITGWDDIAKVSWKAYFKPYTGWRMQFSEDKRSLGEKYDFAKSRNLLGVGMWALGNDGNSPELWDLLREKFGLKLADNAVTSKSINENI